MLACSVLTSPCSQRISPSGNAATDHTQWKWYRLHKINTNMAHNKRHRPSMFKGWWRVLFHFQGRTFRKTRHPVHLLCDHKQYYDTKQNKHRHHHDHVIVDDDDGTQTSPRCPLGHWRATGLFMYANSIPCATVGYSSLPYRSTPRAARQTYEQFQSNANCRYNK